jgi:prevent-host-death family protein
VSFAKKTSEQAAPTVKMNPTLEEDLELSNVTELRQNLLPVIERIEKNPALRIIVLKHGKPQAVLMSAQTYELVKKIMNDVASQLKPDSKEAALESARERLRGERTPAKATVTATQQKVSSQIESLLTTLAELKNNLVAGR